MVAKEANIHTAILEVMGKVGYVQKTGRVDAPGAKYNYAGEADLIAALRPAMLEAGIYIHVVGVTDIQREAYANKSGTHMMNTAVNLALRFTHAPSGTSIDVGAAGEGSDSGDKSTPKALTGAFKVALRQTFCIETGDDPDQQASFEQEREAPKPLEVPEWVSKAGGHAREKEFTFKDCDFLKLRPNASKEEIIGQLKAWSMGRADPLADFIKASEGVIGLSDAAA